MLSIRGATCWPSPADGQTTHDQVMATFAEAEREMLQTLEQEEVATLTRLLDKLARDVERWAPGLPAKAQGG